MKGLIALVAALALTAPVCAAAREPIAVVGGHQYDACFAYVGAYYHVNPLLLRAIAAQESGFNPNSIGKNANGSYDIGVMQINSSWLPRLARAGISASRLISDPCLNIAVGALILKKNIDSYGMSWTAVGAYNASSKGRRAIYAGAVAHHLVAELDAIQKVRGR